MLFSTEVIFPSLFSIFHGYWRHLENFATNTLALIVSSTSFEESDYIRDKEVYIRIKDEK